MVNVTNSCLTEDCLSVSILENTFVQALSSVLCCKAHFSECLLWLLKNGDIQCHQDAVTEMQVLEHCLISLSVLLLGGL